MDFSLKRCKLQHIRTKTWEKAVAPAIEHTIIPKQPHLFLWLFFLPNV